jgi:hypothetical protein
LREYLARHSPDKITEAMDQALADIGGVQDEELGDQKNSFRLPRPTERSNKRMVIAQGEVSINVPLTHCPRSLDRMD